MPAGATPFPALQDARWTHTDSSGGEFVAVTGPERLRQEHPAPISLGGLDQPDSGEIWVDDLALHQAGDAELTRYRRTISASSSNSSTCCPP